uniref:Glutamate--cysteine ligase n=1 Tax=Gallus gallus TaxID=9031 RepID=A0A8V0X4D6_CHICK
MGLLSQGSPLSWEETRRHAEHVRKHGILQFLHIYRALRDRHKDVLKWGDECYLSCDPVQRVKRRCFVL